MYTRRELERWKKSELIDKILELLEPERDEELEYILESAQYATKKDYRVYNAYKSQIENLGLDYKAHQQAVLRLCRILKI